MCPGFDDLADSVGDWFSDEPAPAPVVGQAPEPEAEPEAAESGWLGTMSDLGRGLLDEGSLATALDPAGVIDRQKSKRELAGRFEIVDGPDDGTRLPNQISEAEFDHIARMHSDIRRGHSDIQIHPESEKSNYDQTPEQFRAAMMDDIADIMQTDSGRDLLGDLHDNRQLVDGESVHRKTHLSANVDSTGFVSSEAEEILLEDGDFDDDSGRRGGDAMVMINPNRDVDDGKTHVVRSDVALYHELVHAHTDTHGTSATGLVQASDVPGNANVAKDAATKKVDRAEHQAAGIGAFEGNWLSENNYRSERNAIAFSGRGMGGDLTMEQRLSYSDDFEMYYPYDGTEDF